MAGARITPLPSVSGGSAPASILLIEDDELYARMLAQALRELGSMVVAAGSVGEALATAITRTVDLLVVDRGLADGDGLEVVRGLRAQGREVPFLLLTADASAESAVEAMKAGALDYLVKGRVGVEESAQCIGRLLSFRDAREPRGPTDLDDGTRALVGGSASMRALRASIRRYAASGACVLIEGETGAGKELAARALHAQSGRARGPFVPVNCGALPESLVESELFGHVRGAFTGAHRDHAGLVEQAARGSLFLDEIEDLPLALQGKLLRLLQESEFRPVGAARVRSADIRLIAAANVDLAAFVDAGRFRRDLYYRLDVLRLRVPPLRERLDDLPALITHLAARVRTRGEAAAQAVPPSAEQLRALATHAWPGNVRELASVVERASVVAAESGWGAGWELAVHQLSALPPRSPKPAWPYSSARPPTSGTGRTGAGSELMAERGDLEDLLERHRWRRDAAARELGVSRVTLWRRMRRLGLLQDGKAPLDEGEGH